MELRGVPIIAGEAQGEVIWTDEPLSFWGGYDPGTGRVVDRHHSLYGREVRGRVLVLPAGRGSSTSSGVLLEAVRAGTAPCALVTLRLDPILVLGLVVAMELYGRAPALVQVDAEAFRALAAATRAVVHGDGRIEAN